MTRSIVAFLALVAIISLATACGSGKSQEEIATEVASAWVNSSIGEVSDKVVDLVVGESPVLDQIAGDILADQILDNVMWSYSASKREGEYEYQVTATASVTLSAEIPLLGTKAYVVSMPFILDVDTDAMNVSRWSPDALSASVKEQGE